MSSVMKPRASPSSAPRLGVIHFLLWMLGCAAALTGFRVMTNWSEIAAEDMATVRAAHLGMSMAYGMAAVTFYLLLQCTWRRDGSFPSQPGHWLLVLAAVVALLDGAMAVISRSFAAWRGLYPWDQWMIHQVGGWGLGAILILAVLWRVRLEWRWRMPLFVVLLLAISRAVLLLTIWTTYGRGVMFVPWALQAHLHGACLALGVMTLVTAMASDLLLRLRRDWMHWTGAVTCLGMASVAFLGYVWFEILRVVR